MHHRNSELSKSTEPFNLGCSLLLCTLAGCESIMGLTHRDRQSRACMALQCGRKLKYLEGTCTGGGFEPKAF